ncbi:MAG: hypothetical protein ACE5DK_03095 [Paracoccaceae bacterium]
MDKDGPKKQPSDTRKSADGLRRDDRLKAALRVNLRRRKAQMHARAAKPSPQD